MLDPKQQTWFETTFTQLPEIGQKQMGAIVGGFIADAAVNAILSSSVYESSNDNNNNNGKTIVDFDSLSPQEDENLFEEYRASPECPRLFSTELFESLNRSLENRHEKKLLQQQSASSSSLVNNNINSNYNNNGVMSLYRTWSPASVASMQVLLAVDTTKSPDPSDWAQGIRSGMENIFGNNPSSSSSVNSGGNNKNLNNNRRKPMSIPPEIVSAMTPASVSLFPLLSSIPIIALYPWANDNDVHRNMRVVFEALHEYTSHLPIQVSPEFSLEEVEQQRQGAATTNLEKVRFMQYYLAGASVLLRYLQSNPDPAKNALLRCQGLQSFSHPDYLIDRLDEEHTEKFGSLKFLPSSSLSATSLDSKNHILIPKVMHTAWNILRKDFYQVPSPKQFEKVIQRCVYETLVVKRLSPVATPAAAVHLASYVGACLGAKYGVRNLPVDWMSESDKRSQGGLTKIVSTVVPMQQWIWNPPL